MPDEDELGPSVEDVLYVETLMGWDGDACRCLDCQCPRFLDGTDDEKCRDCFEGRHWAAAG